MQRDSAGSRPRTMPALHHFPSACQHYSFLTSPSPALTEPPHLAAPVAACAARPADRSACPPRPARPPTTPLRRRLRGAQPAGSGTTSGGEQACGGLTDGRSQPTGLLGPTCASRQLSLSAPVGTWKMLCSVPPYGAGGLMRCFCRHRRPCSPLCRVLPAHNPAACAASGPPGLAPAASCCPSAAAPTRPPWPPSWAACARWRARRWTAATTRCWRMLSGERGGRTGRRAATCGVVLVTPCRRCAPRSGGGLAAVASTSDLLGVAPGNTPKARRTAQC